MDFNKAFNSVPREALFKALGRYGFPRALILALRQLYSNPSEYPIVNGRTLASYPLARGLRQGCPLSPILFNLYLNLVLFSLPPHRGTSFSYIDDILFRLSRRQDVVRIFNFFDGDVRLLGLDMNPTKSEVQALEGAPHFQFTSVSGTLVSTLDPQGKPRDFYRYLGVYLYAENQLPRVIEFVSSEIKAYFSTLSPLGLTHTELIRLTNCQLVPILTYRLMAQAVDAPTLRRFDSEIWRNLCLHSRLTAGIPPKTRGAPRKKNGLAIHSLCVSTLKTTYNTALRHLNFEGPPRAGGVIRSYLFSPDSNPVLDQFVDAAQELGVRTHGWGPWNPCRVGQLEPGERLEARGRDGSFHLATVISHGKHKVTIQFPDGMADLGDSADFRFPTELDLDWGSCDHLAPIPSFTSDLIVSAPPLPYGALIESKASEGYWLTVPETVPPPLADDLSHWGCEDAAEAAGSPEPPPMWVYLDGSMSPPGRREVARPGGLDSAPGTLGSGGGPELGAALGPDYDLDPILFPPPPPQPPRQLEGRPSDPSLGLPRSLLATRVRLP